MFLDGFYKVITRFLEDVRRLLQSFIRILQVFSEAVTEGFQIVFRRLFKRFLKALRMLL